MPSRIYDNLKFSSVSIGNSHSIGIIDGKIVGWGSEAKGKLDFSSIEGKKVVSAACGYSHSAFVTEDGLFHAVGNSRDGKMGVPIGNCVSVRCSRNYTAALTFVDGSHKIHVFGLQTPYKTLPSSMYKLQSKNHGIFLIGKVGDYCISDEGELTVANTEGEVYKIGSHINPIFRWADIYHKVDFYDIKVVNPPSGCSALFMLNGVVYACSIKDNGDIYHELMLDRALSIFSGDNYWGYATPDNVSLYGQHFGKIKIPDSFKIVEAFGGNNGYAISVRENGMQHTILCGDNTKNKELVIGNYPSRENPKVKMEQGSEEVVFDVRKGKSEKAPVVAEGHIEPCNLQFKCQDCEYKFLSEISEPTCPLCSKELTVNG